MLVVLLAAGGAYYLASRQSAPTATASPSSRRSGRSSAGKKAAGGSNPPITGNGSRGSFAVVAMTPRNGAAGVSGSSALSITFSEPVAKGSSMPTISPSVPGSWQVEGGRKLVFKPSTPFVPMSQVTVSIPAGRSGLVDTSGQELKARAVDNFTVENGSVLRLQQLLSLLDYSPLSWRPTGQPIAPSDTAAQLQAMYSPPQGTFAWRNTGWPSQLLALWQQGSYNVFTRGLVMEFQADHGLDVTGKVTGALWAAILNALAAGEHNTGGYNYAIGDKVPPQTLTIWHDGQMVFKSPANTGIPQSPTPSGNFNVYARYRHEIMRGKNPDGSSYADPVQYVAYFHDGDAVHYFPRADYGVPQSLGCIELPLAAAAKAWGYLAYGTIVTVLN